MESLLQKIQTTVQNTANAIAKVIQLEVEIADNNFIRVAGTGKYAQQCGELMNAGFVYAHVMQTGQMIMIEHPGHHILCRPCPYYRNCPEHTELAAPLVLNGSIIGVIGLVSFTEEQSKHFMAHKEWMLQFIQKMAELIVSNVKSIAAKSDAASGGPHELNLASLEKNAIKEALQSVASETGKADKAAKMLGISRATLYRKMREYNLSK